jgi:MGT family glycosyltransferase
MKHVLFTSIPAHGHVNPTLPVVEELVRRGHRVSYATHEKFRRAVESAGATLLPTSGDAPTPPPSMNFTPELISGRMERFIELLRTGFPDLLAHAQADPPDAVCYDTMPPIGKMLAEKLELPDIALLPTWASNERFSLRDVMANSLGPNQAAMQQAMGQVIEKMQEFAAEHGVSAPSLPMSAPPASLNIVFLPREFQIAGDTFDERFRFVGPSLGSRASDDSWQPSEDRRPLLLISLGTAFNDRPDFFRMCLEAFGDGEWQVAMAVGEQTDPAALGAIPENIEIRPYFPQPVVLRHATVFLSHTGMNSTMESLQAGVPLVCVPQMPEQEANARRVEELGLGRRLVTTELSADLLRTAVKEVSEDQAIRDNLAEMSKVFQKAGGAVAAADAIEAHMAEKQAQTTTSTLQGS